MKEVILVVEDNPSILYNLEMTLTFNDYSVITAKNGREAINTLNELEKPPDLIISDIVMPEMDGYAFFTDVSSNPVWGHIPFIFLSAKAGPDDIRFGKMLGVDDYITKPLDIDDLLAIVAGKLARKKKIESFMQRAEQGLIKIGERNRVETGEKHPTLFWLAKKEKVGHIITSGVFDGTEQPFPVDRSWDLLLPDAENNLDETREFLTSIESIDMDGYVYYGRIIDQENRNTKTPILLAVIAPKISYLDSLRIRKIFEEMISDVNESGNYNIQHYWKMLSEITLK
ncbi:MAG: response regulator [Candidatus Odinarchaeota archaeon]